MAKDPLAPETLFEHVQDADSFHVPRAFTADGHGHIAIPQPFQTETPLFEASWNPKGLISRNVISLT